MQETHTLITTPILLPQSNHYCSKKLVARLQTGQQGHRAVNISKKVFFIPDSWHSNSVYFTRQEIRDGNSNNIKSINLGRLISSSARNISKEYPIMELNRLFLLNGYSSLSDFIMHKKKLS